MQRLLSDADDVNTKMPRWQTFQVLERSGLGGFAPCPLTLCQVIYPSTSPSSGGMPFGQHSCLHNFVPFTSILYTLPCRVEADVASSDVQFNCAKPSLPRSTGLAMPLSWNTVDDC